MIIGKVNNAIVFSPYSDASSIPPRTASIQSTKLSNAGVPPGLCYRDDSSSYSKSQTNDNLREYADKIFKNFKKEGDLDLVNIENKMKSAGINIEVLKQQFIKIVINERTPSEERAKYIKSFDEFFYRNAQKLKKQSGIVEKSPDESSPFTSEEISTVNFSSSTPSHTRTLTVATELSNASSIGVLPPDKNELSDSSRETSPNATKFSFISNPPQTPPATELSSASRPGTSVSRGDHHLGVLKRLEKLGLSQNQSPQSSK
jgi:hypothetical protein